MPNVTLESSDNMTFTVDENVAKMSTTIKTMLEDLGVNSEDPDEKIPLPNIRGTILRKVIDWCIEHQRDPPVLDECYKDVKRTDDIPPWDQEFLKVDQSVLMDLIMASNYLDIKGLLQNTCKTVANIMKSKTPEEIRRFFNIQNDYTPEKMEEIRKENEWCEER